MEEKEDLSSLNRFQKYLYRIIFGYDTFGGKLFDIVLLIVIIISVLVVMLESVPSFRQAHGEFLSVVEWCFTVLFTIEFLARVYSSPNPKGYVFSFIGFIDIVSLLPSFISPFFAGTHSLLILRSVRLLRVFRVLKLTRYMKGATHLLDAMKASQHKVVAFLGVVLCIVVIMGTLLYLVEGGQNGFTSIPKSIYWAIVTLTTVGYGDIAPQTTLGQTIASFVMILGYAILAVPTGIVSAEFRVNTKGGKVCERCKEPDNKQGANYCLRCGEPFE